MPHDRKVGAGPDPIAPTTSGSALSSFTVWFVDCERQAGTFVCVTKLADAAGD
jgi:hypothetical protein